MNDQRQRDNARLARQVVLGLSGAFVFALFWFIVAPGLAAEGRVTPAAPTGKKAPASSEGWLDPTEAPAEKGREIQPVDPAQVMTPNAELLGRGQALYTQNCVPCHGEQGQGDGPSAPTLNPRPRDFTRPAGWTHGHRIPDIYQTLTEGVPGTSMVAYEYLPPRDRMALVHFVRALGKLEHPEEDPAAIAALSAQFKKPGGRVPNRIPVQVAMARLQAEAIPALPLQIPEDGPASALLRRAVGDRQRAAQALASADAWREDPKALARLAVAGAPANGFTPSVATFTSAEWQTLQAELARSSSGAKERR